ncbi:MAG: HlyD family efflux transporter periplasmic adaptor subunit [Calditrichaeota bacterium]|nr:HlyD family efflux transporter periplasmic adaptor subunit [Calditrichota bacterium]
MRVFVPIFYPLLVLFLISCQQQDKTDAGSKKAGALWESYILIKNSFPVDIPIEGKLVAWQKMDLSASRRSRLISLLVEKGDEVRKGDFLLSLWTVGKRANLTPIDFFAPLKGRISEINYQLNDTIPEGSVILTIENRENLILKAALSPGQIYYVKRNANVTLTSGDLEIKGAVLKVDKKAQQVTVIVPNQRLKLNRDLLVRGMIHLKEVKGNYLPLNVFQESDSVSARVESYIEITIYRVGVVSDSLALIFPTIPDVNQIQIKKNLDIIK